MYPSRLLEKKRWQQQEKKVINWVSATSFFLVHSPSFKFLLRLLSVPCTNFALFLYRLHLTVSLFLLCFHTTAPSLHPFTSKTIVNFNILRIQPIISCLLSLSLAHSLLNLLYYLLSASFHAICSSFKLPGASLRSIYLVLWLEKAI